MKLALSFSGFMADVPIPCLVLNLLFMKEVSKGPKCSHVLHICLHRGTMTLGDRTEFGKKFSSMTVLWIRTSKSSHGPGSQLPTLNIRMIWGELDSADQHAYSHCAKSTVNQAEEKKIVQKSPAMESPSLVGFIAFPHPSKVIFWYLPWKLYPVA